MLPSEVGVIEQDPHQFGHGQRGVRVVELDGDLLRQRAPVGAGAAETPQEIGERTGDEEIFLHEPQPLPHARRVVGIEDSGERLGAKRLGQRADEIAARETLEVEVGRRRRRPKAKRVDRLAAVTDDRAVERNSDQARSPAGNHAQRAGPQLESATEFDLHGLVGADNLPRVRAAQPVVGLFVLPAVLD